MTILKIFFALFVTAVLSGCMSGNYYILSTASQPNETYEYRHQVIGVEKVSVPEYLFKREIAVAKSSSEVVFLSGATWAEDLNAGLTQRLISFIQKKFNQPNVHAYPWGVDKQPNKRVKVEISRFIAYEDKVYLDAIWEVQNMRTGKTRAKLFSTTVKTSSYASDIVAAMDKAFGELEENVVQGLRK
jgi:cholesterol transport system auxiliary component